MRPMSHVVRALAVCGLLGVCGAPAFGGVHLWRVKEIFSSPDGTVQFIELATCCGSTTENSLSGQSVRSTTRSFTIPSNVVGSTLNKHLLLGTQAFADLPGAPRPDYIIPANFFSTVADTISFAVYDTLIFPAGALPTDGTTSLNKNPDDVSDTTFPSPNSPTNYAGQSGMVSVISGPPGVPDGTGGAAPVTVTASVPDGSILRVAFDTSSCTHNADHHILFGQRGGLPAAPGGTFTLMGSVCRIGAGSPYEWVDVPRATDGSDLLWFLLVATDETFVEGSWGVDSFGEERHGPGNGGSSGSCAVVKSVANGCGHASP